MLMNLKTFIFEQLDKEAYDKPVNDINTLVFENFTPSELEKRSMSNQYGKMYIQDNGNILTFESRLFKELVTLKLEHSLDELIIGDVIGCELIESNTDNTDHVSNYVGGGSLTNNHGIDFIFSSPFYEGKFTIEEKTGFNRSVKLTRVA